MDVAFRQINPHACRSYLAARKGGRETVLIDPVLEHLDDILALLEAEDRVLTLVVDTHTHADHISGASALKDLTGCAYAMHASAPAACVDTPLRDGESLDLLGTDARILHTPGHTADAVCLVLPDRIFTGDTLFLDEGGAGRDDLPGGDPGAHWESLERLKALPDALNVYPAHEYRNREPSGLGAQKARNPHLRHRTKEAFVAYLEDLALGPADWMKDVLKANYACARDPKAAWVPVDLPACEVQGTRATGVNDQATTGTSPEALRERLRGEHPPLLLDVRNPHELQEALGRLPGALNVPIQGLTGRLAELEPHRTREIVTVCRSGARAHSAAQILQQAGFPSVSVLEGGMIAWRERFPD